jgi:hypothetical protein
VLANLPNITGKKLSLMPVLLMLWTVAVPKFPSIPRLTIVVPIGNNLLSFEDSLISVLENLPADCEVMVASDGSYDDPFELSDEVRFVTAPSNKLVDLVAAATAQSRARFVHVLADGIRATSGWIDGAMEKFEHEDAAVVAPVIWHQPSQRIVAAGWCDRQSRLCDPAQRNRKSVSTQFPNRIGAYLQASLWRREVLLSMMDAFAGRDPVEASYAYEYLLRAAGWRCVLAPESNLQFSSYRLPWEDTSASRGQRLRAIRSHFHRNGGWGHALLAASRAVLANGAHPGYLAEAVGQALAPLAAIDTKRLLRPAAVRRCDDDATILIMPQRQQAVGRRRAA